MNPKQVHIVIITLLCKIKKTSKIICKHGEIDLSTSNDITNLGHTERGPNSIS